MKFDHRCYHNCQQSELLQNPNSDQLYHKKVHFDASIYEQTVSHFLKEKKNDVTVFIKIIIVKKAL